jgi:hypothetical protein
MTFLGQLICPSGGVREFLSSPLAKIFCFRFSNGMSRASRLDEEGRYARIVTKREARCGGRDDVVCA